MRFVLIGGNTDTVSIDGISAAGINPAVMIHTPSADLELVEYGYPVQAPVPVGPTGCPTPAVITRAIRELLEFDAKLHLYHDSRSNQREWNSSR